MSDGGRRPGGLTALAILNFVCSGFWGLVFVGPAARLMTTDPSAKGASTIALAALIAAVTGLLITSGMGYLGMKRVLGRLLGNACALASLAAISLLTVGPGFGIVTMILLVYPLFTLVVVNTTFKDDLVQ